MNENEFRLFGRKVVEKGSHDFEVDLGQFKHEIKLTLKIRQKRIDKLRQKIGLAIMKCGCLIAGFSGLELETNNEPDMEESNEK